MKYRDTKANILTEVLGGFRQIRLSGLEVYWEQRLLDVRASELSRQWQSATAMCLLVVMVNIGSSLLSALPLSIFVLRSNALSASVAFTCLGLFKTLQDSLTRLPLVWTYLVEAWTSCQRLESFLRQLERQNDVTPSQTISAEQATISWPSARGLTQQAEHFQLSNLTFQFPRYQLSIVTGRIGSGKSLLLSAILDEARLHSGIMTAPVSTSRGEAEIGYRPHIALVSQHPWLENNTIKDNILFGSSYDSTRYQEVLNACALDEDLRALQDGDLTTVGSKGLSMSGGQRWRISLARALYSNAKTIIMADILSAVDVHVRRWLVKKALCGKLAKGRTRILATHHDALCRSQSSFIIHLSGGRIERTEVLEPLLVTQNEPEDEENKACSPGPRMIYPEKEGLSTDVGSSTQSSSTRVAKSSQQSWRACQRYVANSGGFSAWAPVVGLVLLIQLLAVGRIWWLQKWTENANRELNEMAESSMFVTIYLGFSVGFFLSLGLKCLAVYSLGLRASNMMFNRMTHSILRASCEWTEKTQQGHIVSRFTSDMSTVDLQLPHNLGYMIECLTQIVCGIFAR